jgi:hypothetical protein
MKNCTRYLGLDVHAETITAAIAAGRERTRGRRKIRNRPEACAVQVRARRALPAPR